MFRISFFKMDVLAVGCSAALGTEMHRDSRYASTWTEPAEVSAGGQEPNHSHLATTDSGDLYEKQLFPSRKACQIDMLTENSLSGPEQ